MNSKLTLRLDSALISHAKLHARRQGKSVSQMVSDYFRTISRKPRQPERRIYGAITSKLYGALRGAEVSESDYRNHLGEKHL